MTFRTERIFVLSAILLIGLGLVLAISRGALRLSGNASAGLLWSMTVALSIAAAAGHLWLRAGMVPASEGGPASGDDRIARLAVRFLPLGAVLPALLVAGATLFVQIFENGIVQTMIIASAAISLGAIYWAQVHAVDIQDRYFGLAQAILNVSSHLCAFLLFATIYGLKTRALISATAVGLATLLLMLELLSRAVAWHITVQSGAVSKRSTIVLLSLAAGLVMTELTWGLNYWAALTTLVGGAFLLVAFYVVYGLTSHYLERNMSRQTALEYGLVGLAGIAAVFVSAFLGL
jgi:hypothetical protein